MQPATDNIGFTDAVRESQSTFRAVINALSRPGLPIDLANLPAGPTTLPSGLAAVALTLLDYDTTVWLDEQLAVDAEVRRFIAFHTNAPVTNDTAQATFALLATPQKMPALADFAQGSLEYPDRSTTLVIEVESLVGGAQIAMQGPGIKTIATIAPTSLPDNFTTQLAANRELFPCGVDIILSCGQTIVGLPRSVRIVEA